jgi:hypothetical protein
LQDFDDDVEDEDVDIFESTEEKEELRVLSRDGLFPNSQG